ncbi:hypothetical protein NUU61_000857 [Penicillium alfredii]|uniref:Uncharacterized protein n=1 Tax=Penicillium alfredii TaxID=1506179 RepID=A0A9W9GAW4_9EURO|nr:uncharacterized protein NUU61_000857 [Penicillium alfredii]KAJ5115098.1 hypothetical protein NUU61_000857 [Penicillium alfredii]
MKSFAIAAAILATTAAALPTKILNGGSPVSIPSGVPSCLPSGIIPSGVPVPSGIPTCLPSTDSSSQGTNAASNTASGAAQNVFTVTHESRDILVQLQPKFAGLLENVNLPTGSAPVGQVISTASELKDLSNPTSSTSGLLTVASQGQVFLIQLNKTVTDLLSSLGLAQLLGLDQVGQIVGSVLPAAPSLPVKRDAVSDVMTITNEQGEEQVVKLEGGLLSLLTGPSLATVEGPIGKAVGSAQSVPELSSQIPQGADATKYIAVLAEDGSPLLVQVTSTTAAAQGLLSALGLSQIQTYVGQITSPVAASGATGALPIA